MGSQLQSHKHLQESHPTLHPPKLQCVHPSASSRREAAFAPQKSPRWLDLRRSAVNTHLIHADLWTSRWQLPALYFNHYDWFLLHGLAHLKCNNYISDTVCGPFIYYSHLSSAIIYNLSLALSAIICLCNIPLVPSRPTVHWKTKNSYIYIFCPG